MRKIPVVMVSFALLTAINAGQARAPHGPIHIDRSHNDWHCQSEGRNVRGQEITVWGGYQHSRELAVRDAITACGKRYTCGIRPVCFSRDGQTVP
jgi:hypothetical protein